MEKYLFCNILNDEAELKYPPHDNIEVHRLSPIFRARPATLPSSFD